MVLRREICLTLTVSFFLITHLKNTGTKQRQKNKPKKKHEQNYNFCLKQSVRQHKSNAKNIPLTNGNGTALRKYTLKQTHTPTLTTTHTYFTQTKYIKPKCNIKNFYTFFVDFFATVVLVVFVVIFCQLLFFLQRRNKSLKLCPQFCRPTWNETLSPPFRSEFQRKGMVGRSSEKKRNAQSIEFKRMKERNISVMSDIMFV